MFLIAASTGIHYVRTTKSWTESAQESQFSMRRIKASGSIAIGVGLQLRLMAIAGIVLRTVIDRATPTTAAGCIDAVMSGILCIQEAVRFESLAERFIPDFGASRTYHL